MLKGAWILPAAMLMGVVVTALVPDDTMAAEGDVFTQSPQTFFKNLPGVKPTESLVKSDPDAYSCTSDIGYVSELRSGPGARFWDDVPRRLYHCETNNGIRYTGTQMPNTHWVPGINPRHLPK